MYLRYRGKLYRVNTRLNHSGPGARRIGGRLKPDIWRSWIPGVLANGQLRELIDAGYVSGVDPVKPDGSAIDLHVGIECHELMAGTIKPFGEGFRTQMLDSGAKPSDLESDGSWHLQRKRTYVLTLRESLEGLYKGPIWGQATAKSSVGRVDVLARLVVDGMKHYERFDPDSVAKAAPMFLEVTPITFGIRVRPGDSLSQLRFFYGDPDECELKGEEICYTCLGEAKPQLTVDLTPVPIVGAEGCGFRALESDGPFIPLWREGGGKKKKAITDPASYWELVRSSADQRLRIEVDRFYILRSKQRLRVHPDVAVYARAIDEEIGEMRIHYAGFAHPRFGWGRLDDKEGTPLIFEVRGHSVPVSLQHDEMLARLQFFRMSDTPVANDLQDDDGSYNQQELKLSKYFKDWSSTPRLADDK